MIPHKKSRTSGDIVNILGGCLNSHWKLPLLGWRVFPFEAHTWPETRCGGKTVKKEHFVANAGS
jgi:hypothetical protein